MSEPAAGSIGGEASAAAVPQSSSPNPGASPGKLARWWRVRREDPNPILVKELRSVFRTKLFIRFLYLSTGLLALCVLMFGGMVASSSMAPAEVGRVVFQIFFGLALAVLCVFAPAHAAASLTGEREKGTYESLILTGMDPSRIVLGKFMATFAVFALVVVAFIPVVGIAFLFGGISPWYVLWGLWGLLVVLAPATAYGVSLSARLNSSRIAIFVALFTFVPLSMFLGGTVWALGEVAQRSWSIGMEGPFWFAEALAARFFEWDTFLLVFVLPAYLSLTAVWLLLATAIAGVRPASDDRSTPFKYWALTSIVGFSFILFGIVSILEPHERGEVGTALLAASGLVVAFYALLFQNEPPLPPRMWELERRKRGPLGAFARLFGPGAAPTTRFAMVAIALACLCFFVAVGAPRWLSSMPSSDPAESHAAQSAVALGNAVTCAFLLCLGVFVRIVVRSGVAARILANAVFIALVLVPFLIVLVIDAALLERIDEHPPLVVRLTPIFHAILAVNIHQDDTPRRAVEVVPELLFYGAGALALWLATESRVIAIGKAVAARRQARLADAKEVGAELESARSSGTPEEIAAALARVGVAEPEALAATLSEPASINRSNLETDPSEKT